jgi:hypothetical protein
MLTFSEAFPDETIMQPLAAQIPSGQARTWRLYPHLLGDRVIVLKQAELLCKDWMDEG